MKFFVLRFDCIFNPNSCLEISEVWLKLWNCLPSAWNTHLMAKCIEQKLFAASLATEMVCIIMAVGRTVFEIRAKRRRAAAQSENRLTATLLSEWFCRVLTLTLLPLRHWTRSDRSPRKYSFIEFPHSGRWFRRVLSLIFYSQHNTKLNISVSKFKQKCPVFGICPYNLIDSKLQSFIMFFCVISLKDFV